MDGAPSARMDESIGTSVDAILEAAREAAPAIVGAEQQTEDTRLAVEADAARVHRDRVVHDFESLAQDTEDALAELAPASTQSSPGETFDVRSRS